MRLITVPTLFAVLLRCAATQENSSDAADNKFVKSLRRQLTKDNYDYITDVSEECLSKNHNFRKQYKSDETIQKHLNLKENVEQHTKHEWNNNRKDEIKDYKSNISETEFMDENLRHKTRRRNRRIKQKINRDSINDKPKSTMEQPGQENIISFEDMGAKYVVLSNVTKYKVLKLKNKYRRNNNVVTLIQEESPDGVAIVNLGNGPFPQIRLPSSRRQYMHDPLDIGAFDDDDELPPPPASDTKLSPETSDEKAKSKKSTAIQIEQHSNNKVADPFLKITITPDEILVL